MSKVGKIIGLLAIAVFVPAGFYVSYGLYSLMSYCVKFKKYKLDEIGKDNIKLSFSFEFKNPSYLSVDIIGYNIDVFLNGTKISNLFSADPNKIEAGKTSMLTLPVSIDYKKLFDKVKSAEIVNDFIFKNYDKIVFEFKGKFIGKMMKIKINKELNIKYSLKELLEMSDAPSKPCLT